MDDIVFEMELIKQVEINIDYILGLIKKYHSKHMDNKEIEISVAKAIDASVELRNKKELILRFINSINPKSDIDKDWTAFVDKAKIAELNQIIADENLNKEKTYKFIKNAFRDGLVQTTGTEIVDLLPPVSIFSKDNNITAKRETVIDKIIGFFNKFFGISNGEFVEGD